MELPFILLLAIGSVCLLRFGLGDSPETCTAENIFNEFRNEMGDQEFDQLLHLNKKVLTMAFVIDVSGSDTIENNMDRVREYINQLIVEQEKSETNVVYMVTTFGGPTTEVTTKVFRNKIKLKNYLNNLESRVEGDCVERTCYSMLRTLYKADFTKTRNAAMYIFTDARSKQCDRLASNIIRSFQFAKASAFFIHFDSCIPVSCESHYSYWSNMNFIDPIYVRIAQNTGGFSLLVRDNAVYNVSNSDTGVFESDDLVCGSEL